jgi:hypothetical protein
MKIKLETLVNSMQEYQKLHEIKKQCITNVRILMDALNNNCKAKAVFACYYDKELGNFVIVGHVVVYLGDKIIDPSYDVAVYKPSYFNNYADLVKESGTAFDSLNLASWIELVKCVANINEGHLYIDKSYYEEIIKWIRIKNSSFKRIKI